ncbi:hypothetical protein ADN00_00940 [Ornatilinea apprima]|uniref:histidine kinase n=1 Tax=Ornatilinea apprima TaxID=1134406 RepID=A0A0P6XMP5_9CHLR|nr:HAMP domain-containing sensor histidine kinase [Ornatilinea apprima]KPL81119.1 hypothetical protein ADN00_00940 [Ornatilinea apprima]
MSIQESLQSIQAEWIHQILIQLSPEDPTNEDLIRLVSHFFAQFSQAVINCQPAFLEPEIENFSSALPSTDLEGKSNQVSQFLKIFVDTFYHTGRETLSAQSFLELLDAAFPVTTRAFEISSDLETKSVRQRSDAEIETLKQQMEKIDRSKSDFIAVAAHELKTPLTLIEGYSMMLKEIIIPDGNDYQASLIDGIRNGTRRLKMIIDDMVDVTLIENNLLKLNFQPVWLNQLFAHLQAELQPALDQRFIRLEIDPFPGFSEMTFGAPDRLEQVFRNILNNAIKFTPDHGWIYIEGRQLPGFIEVIVRDTGIGINPEDQPLIFNKFSRIGNVALHSSGKTKFKGGGPGLGLYIAKGIVESHGGAIWVESEKCDEDKLPGSAFHVILPTRSALSDDKMTHLFSNGPKTYHQEVPKQLQ